MSSKVASAIRGAACCGPRGSRAKRSGRCNARAPGSSYPGHRQRPRSWVPYVKSHPRTWHRKGNALLSIANVSACRPGPCDRPKRNLINCVRNGRRYRLQAQGDFCGIAKKGKRQIVIGLLCDEDGHPVSIEVFPGNTQDPHTFAAQLTKVKSRFGATEITFVGDRGMIKGQQIDNLVQHGFHYITAITKPQIEKLLRTGTLQIELF